MVNNSIVKTITKKKKKRSIEINATFLNFK